MKIVVALIAVAILAAGCVTTTTGDVIKPGSTEEAARLNMDLGISYLRQGDYEQAMTKLEKSLEENPDNATAHRALGLVYERLGDNSRAEKEYRTAVRQDPNDADALNQLAVFVCLQGDESEAMDLFNRALNIPLYQSRYMIYANAGKCAKDTDLVLAEDYLRRALALRKDFPEALFQLADVAMLRGNYLQARAFVDRYQSLGPAAPDVLWLGYQVEIALDDPIAARSFATQLLKEFPESVEARLLLEERRNAG